MKGKTTLISLLAIALVAAVVAGCGGGNNTATASSSQSGSGSHTIAVSDNSSLGKVLVDSKGRTVYLFQKDTGSMSTCSGACATDWPPVTTTGKPTAGSGLTASMVGTTTRSDGTKQVTYNGHPLYTFVGDSKAGDTAGQGLNDFGASWWAVSPSGSEVTGGGSGSSSGGSSAY
jgi:predicted lipoprotein with Yx(FWY)xxD motif